MTDENKEECYIYKCSWYEDTICKNSHTDMYFENVKHTYWVFDTPDYFNGLADVKLIKVSKNSYEYISASSNSLAPDGSRYDIIEND
jgi:hypothetical protein